MRMIVIDSHTKLSVDSFLQRLNEAEQEYDPVDELLELKEELESFEQKYDMPSTEFYRRYLAGEMGDSIEVIGWAGTHRLYTQLKMAISDSLKLVVADRLPRRIESTYAPESLSQRAV